MTTTATAPAKRRASSAGVAAAEYNRVAGGKESDAPSDSDRRRRAAAAARRSSALLLMIAALAVWNLDQQRKRMGEMLGVRKVTVRDDDDPPGPMTEGHVASSKELPRAAGKLEKKYPQRQRALQGASDEPDARLRALYESDGNLQISRKYGLVFVHVPKSGGSSIEQSRLFKGKWPQAAGHAPISRFIEGAEGIDNYTSFAIVRDPCERFLSAFHYIAKGGRNRMDRKWARENVGNMTLEEWVGRGIRDDYPHFEHMWRYTFLEGPAGGAANGGKGSNSSSMKMGVDKIFCQEHFAHATRWVNSHVGFTLFMDVPYRRNRGSHGTSCRDMREDIRRAIEDFYALDYCVFGYNGEGGIRNGTVSGRESPGCAAEGFSKLEFTKRLSACRNKHHSIASP